MKLVALPMPAALRAIVAVAAALAAMAPPARAVSTLDAPTLKAFGGTYAADCRKSGGARVVVAADTLAVEQGKKRIESHDVQRAVTYSGRTPPADYQGSLLGDVPGGEPLVFHVYRDTRGIYLVVDADSNLQSAFGKSAFAPRFRSCGPPPSEPPATSPAAPQPPAPAAPRPAKPGAPSR